MTPADLFTEGHYTQNPSFGHFECSDSAVKLLWQRFSHLQHGMVILFVRELTRNLPPLTEIELHGNRIRPNDAKAARQVTTGSYLSFTLRE